MIVTFCFIALFFRLFIIQQKNSEPLQLKAVSQWVRSLPLTAQRGEILDINNNVLATSYTTYDVYVRAKDVENAVEVATYLSSKLNLDFNRVYEKVKNIYISEVLLKLQVDKQTARDIMEKGYSGVFISENVGRYYPYGQTLTQVLGYMTSDAVGQAGIESYYNNILSGTDGKFLSQSDVKGLQLNESLNYYIDAIDGDNLKLTVDVQIQLFAEEILECIMQDHSPKKASILVLNPQTSEVVSLAISPSFDLNDIPRDDVQVLMDCSKNIAITDVYEPGSTFKILTLCAALSENIVSVNDRFFCPGYRIVDGERIKCWRTIGHGSQTLAEGVQNSCNCVFMDLALKLGKEKLYKYLQAFGIGTQTGVDMVGESGGILMNIENVQTVDLARIGFGQAVAVNQLQLLNAFCAAINGGKLYKPYIMESVVDVNSNLLQKNSSMQISKVVSKEVSEIICNLLEGAVNKTGSDTFVPGYSVGGKTGTAQKYENGGIASGKYVSSFFGFFPTEKPEYAILVCVDEPSSGAYYGSVVAKPYGQMLFEKIIEYRQYPPKSVDVVAKYITVRDYVNMPLSKAIANLEMLGVEYEIAGDGGVVLGQYPQPNTTVSMNSTIILNT